MGERKRNKHQSKRALKIIFSLNNLDVLSRDRVRKFGTPILKCINSSTRTKTNQSAKSNLSVENLQSGVAITSNQSSACPSRYYCIINGKRIGEATLSEMENVISIITDHFNYLEAQQLRNVKSASDRSPAWSKPAITNFWKIYKP